MKNMRKRILVVEDDPAMRNLAQAILEELGGHAVRTACDGSSAHTLLRVNEPFDLVLLDITLAGGESGLDIAKSIRGRYACPIVFMTGHDLLSEQRAAADGYLKKPFHCHELVDEVERVLRVATIGSPAPVSA